MPNNQAHDTRTTVAEDRVAAAVSLSVAAVVSGGGKGSLPESYQLPAANFVAAKRPLKILQPHQTLTSSESVYSWAEPGVTYELPISAVFGAYPYFFEIVDGPVSMTVGEFFVLGGDGVTLIRPTNYGVVSFDVPASGMDSFTYTVRITDQEGNSESVVVNVTVSANKFLHLDASAADGGAGTAVSPLNKFSDVWKNDTDDATYAGKILRIHAGNYVLYGDPGNSGNVNFDGSKKPKIWINQPGETPVFDCSQAKILYNGGNMDDSAFIGIKYENARSDVSNSHFFWTTTSAQRGLFWRNKFKSLGKGQAGNDNPACIFIPAEATSSYVVKDNEGDTIAGPIYDTYNLTDSLLEGNRAINSTSNETHFIKGTATFCCVRHEEAVSGITGTFGLSLMMANTAGTSHDNEFCYNRIVMQNTSVGEALKVAWSSTAVSHYSQWCYRNTLVGRARQLNADSSEWAYEKNIYTNDFPIGSALTLSDNVIVSVNDIDADGVLTGQPAITYAGTHGADISGVG